VAERTRVEKPTREGSPAKRAAILTAARDLFVQQGVDRVSMDAVAATAKVSKATVYDYFGDKRRLFRAILADMSQALLDTVHRALDEHLPHGAPVATVPQLEERLAALAIDLGTSVVGSADYADVFALVAQQRLRTSVTGDDSATEAVVDIATDAVVDALADRIADLVDAGIVETDRPRLAAEHFFALTMLLAYDRYPSPVEPDPEGVRQTMIDGVHAFIRAYGRR